MNILLLNANNPFETSGVVALNLFNELKSKGHTVKLVTNNYDSNYPNGITSMESCFYKFWKNSILHYKLDGIKRKLNLKKEIIIDHKYEFLEFREQNSFYRTNNILKKADINPDVIIILFAKRFINTKNIYELYKKTNAKIYWLMYDMAPLTGGCHYAWDCTGYYAQCGKCPGLISSDPFDLTYKNHQYKKHYIDKAKVQIIAASEWQYRQASESSLFKERQIHKILLSADPNIFKPANVEKEKNELNILASKKVIFFGSVELTTIRKGMSYLLESLKILKERIKGTHLENNILLLIAGKNIDGIVDSLPFEFHYLGLVDNTYGIAKAYQLADVFLCPSIEDSGPTMINQSVMSGTPVISFEMGVAMDLVINGKTGYRAKIKDSEDMAHGLFKILSLSDDAYFELSNNCRELALKLCSPEIQTELFENLFNN